jgi:tetratricopeptide (TPR) repeat protein
VDEAAALAVMDLNRGNFRGAASICDLIVSRFPGYAQAHNSRGLALQGLKRYNEALASYEKAIDLEPKYADAHLNRGNVFLVLRRFDKALEGYDRLIAFQPDHAAAYNCRGIALQELRQSDQALASYDKAISIDPACVTAHSNRGLILKAMGRRDEALASFDKAIAMQPDNALTHNNRGLVLNELTRYHDAVASFDKAIALKRDYAVAHNNRGVTLRELKQLDLALESFDTAVGLKPDYAAAHDNRGLVLLELKRLDEALASFDKATAFRPDHAAAHNNRGVALRELERYEEALASFDRAIAIKPDYAIAHDNRGRALNELKRFEEALASCDRAIALDPGSAEAHNSRGAVLSELRLYDEALASCDKAIALNVDRAEAYDTRGAILAIKGQMQEAEEMFRKALALKPDLPMPLYRLTAIRKYRDADHEDVRGILQLLNQRPATLPHRDSLYFALGKAYDDCGRYGDAFECYRQANQICNARVSYDPERVRRMIDRVIDVFSKEFLAQTLPFASDSRSPLFVLGMPRSGTTLIASALSNHPSVGTVGELTVLSSMTSSLPKLIEKDIPYPEAVKHITADAAGRLTDGYLRRLRRDVEPDVAHIIDKAPQNFRYLGLISTLFPNARVVHCMREPMDTCLSIYFQHFSLGHDYSFDLRNIGDFYRQYERIMAHWRTALPVPMIEIEYEDMIANTEKVVGRTLEALGLSWDDRCLAPHTNKNAVHTASQWQVRQPIYGHSVERWRNYEQYLAPLREALGRTPQ